MATKPGDYIGGTTDSYSSSRYNILNSGSELSLGSGKDLVRPQIVNLTPTPGTPIDRNTQVLSFDVTDNLGLFTRILILAKFAGNPVIELIHDGDSFTTLYQNGGSLVTPIAGGFHYDIFRFGGWPAEVTFEPFAIDTSGNENL